MFTQHTTTCAEHHECTLIYCREDATGRIVWESHAHHSTHPECRANPDYPLHDPDGRPLDPTRDQCESCREHLQ